MRCPEHDIRVLLAVPESFGGPGVAGIVGGHLDVSLSRPGDKILRLPDLEIKTAFSDSVAPGCTTTDGKVGGDEKELVAFNRANNKWVSQALGALC
ncbi:hypothetical protein HG531_000848 [Fusarium graminearum]|nr:hypothetical protein HG531_000848 [Fusarium graminearum]